MWIRMRSCRGLWSSRRVNRTAEVNDGMPLLAALHESEGEVPGLTPRPVRCRPLRGLGEEAGVVERVESRGSRPGLYDVARSAGLGNGSGVFESRSSRPGLYDVARSAGLGMGLAWSSVSRTSAHAPACTMSPAARAWG
jgi:hypothetical protein